MQLLMTTIPIFLAICLHYALGSENMSSAQLFPVLRVKGSIPGCTRQCRFFFCRPAQTKLFGAPNEGQDPQICRRGQDIAQIIESGEAQILTRTDKKPIPISQWRPDGLDTPYAPDYFKAVAIKGEENSGISHSPSIGNQNDFTNDICVRLPILRYERKTRRGIKIITAGGERDCIGVTVRTPDIIIEAQWYSGADFDLAVTEPDGTVLSNENAKSICGKYAGGGDKGVDTCGISAQAVEKVRYRDSDCPGFQIGRYTATLRQVTNCGDGPTDWEIRLVVRGRLVRKWSGSSDEDAGSRVARVRFRL